MVRALRAQGHARRRRREAAGGDAEGAGEAGSEGQARHHRHGAGATQVRRDAEVRRGGGRQVGPAHQGSRDPAGMKRRVMVVTGGSRGIGASVARLAAVAGYDVAVNFVRNEKAADAGVRAVEEAGGRGAAFRADVGDDSHVARMFAEIDKALGRVHVLVNNAGILGNRRVEDMNEASLLEIFRANVFSMYYCSREAVRRMSTKHGGKGGVIINMSSVASRLGGLAGGSAYAAT